MAAHSLTVQGGISNNVSGKPVPTAAFALSVLNPEHIQVAGTEFFDLTAVIKDSISTTIGARPGLTIAASLKTQTANHSHITENLEVKERTLSVKNSIHAAISANVETQAGILLTVLNCEHTHDPTVVPVGSLGKWWSQIVDGKERNVTVPIEDGRSYDFRIRSMTKYGVVSEWDTNYDHTATKQHSTYASNYYVKGGTFGTAGIQMEYNSGTARFYCGDGSTKYLQFDGTNVSWRGANSSLNTDGTLSLGQSGTTITLDPTNVYIRSSDYVSGVAGAGFTLEPGLLETGNIACRGIFRTAVFQNDVISAIGGNLWVRPSDVLDADMTAADNSTVTIEGNETFTTGDFLRIKDGTDDEWMEITDHASAPTYTVTRDKGSAYGADANPAWKKGASVVNFGQSGDGGIYLTSSLSNAPYASVYTQGATPWSGLTTQVRMGNLNGTYGLSADKYGFAAGDSSKSNGYIIINGTDGAITLSGGAGTRIEIDGTNGVFSINSSTFGNSGIQLDYNSGSPQFYCGDGSNEYLKYTTAGGVLISTAKSDAITIKSGGNIKLEAGGDLELYGHGSDPAELKFYDTGSAHASSIWSTDAAFTEWQPAADSSKNLEIGDLTTRWNNIDIVADGEIDIVAYYNGNNQSRLYLDCGNATNNYLYVRVVDDGNSETFYFEYYDGGTIPGFFPADDGVAVLGGKSSTRWKAVGLKPLSAAPLAFNGQLCVADGTNWDVDGSGNMRLVCRLDGSFKYMSHTTAV